MNVAGSNPESDQTRPVASTMDDKLPPTPGHVDDESERRERIQREIDRQRALLPWTEPRRFRRGDEAQKQRRRYGR